MTAEIDDALEDTEDRTVYVYQATISYREQEFVAVKAYDINHARQLIEEGFAKHPDLTIDHLQLSSHDTYNSILNKTIS